MKLHGRKKNIFSWLRIFKSRACILIFTAFSSVYADAADTTAYVYDALGRLVGVKQNGAVKEGYSYDKAGNRCAVSATEIVADEYCKNTSNSYTSSWNYGATSVVANVTDADGVFEITWSPASNNGLLILSDYKLRHTYPNGTNTYESLGLVYSKSFANLASGVHRFDVNSCGVTGYDDDEYEILGCTAWIGVIVTVQ